MPGPLMTGMQNYKYFPTNCLPQTIIVAEKTYAIRSLTQKKGIGRSTKIEGPYFQLI